MPVLRAGLPGKQDHFFGAAALRIGIRDQLQPGALRVHRPKSAASRPACPSAVRTMCAFSNMASVLWPTQRPAPEFVHATQIPALYHGIWLPVTVLFSQRPRGRNLPSCGRRTASGAVPQAAQEGGFPAGAGAGRSRAPAGLRLQGLREGQGGGMPFASVPGVDPVFEHIPVLVKGGDLVTVAVSIRRCR